MAGRRTGRGRTRDQIRQARAEIARLYLQGTPQAELAAQLGVSQQQVSYDLQQIRKAWQASAIADFDRRVAEELAHIDHLERTYWTAWEKSTQERERSTSYLARGEDGQPQQVRGVIQTAPGLGDPRWLSGVQWCIDRRCRLLGLDKPQRVDVTTGGQVLGRAFEEALAKVYGEETLLGDGNDGDDGDDAPAGDDAGQADAPGDD